MLSLCPNFHEMFYVLSHLIEKGLRLRTRVVASELQSPALPPAGRVALGHLVNIYLPVPKYSHLKIGIILVPTTWGCVQD